MKNARRILTSTLVDVGGLNQKHLFLGRPISQLARAWNQAVTEARAEGFLGRLWKARWAVPLPPFSPHGSTLAQDREGLTPSLSL